MTCAPDAETGLKVTASGTTITFEGTGKDPSYYTFQGTFNAAKTTITGSLKGPGVKEASPFTLTLGAKQVPSSCVPAPGPAPPGPAPSPKDNPSLWPMPKSFSNGNTTVTIVPSATFFDLSTASPILAAAIGRYTPLTFPHAAAPSLTAGVGVSGLKISVTSAAEDFPQLETDETYTLTIPEAGGVATLTAATVYGALHGMETFSQLVAFDFETETYQIMYAPWVIDDAPRFPHRGLMIDTARHFETLDAIRKIIDSLVYAKINVLHWHMSDSQVGRSICLKFSLNPPHPTVQPTHSPRSTSTASYTTSSSSSSSSSRSPSHSR